MELIEVILYDFFAYVLGCPCFFPYAFTFPSRSGATKSQTILVIQVINVSNNQLFLLLPPQAQLLIAAPRKATVTRYWPFSSPAIEFEATTSGVCTGSDSSNMCVISGFVKFSF